MANDILLTVKEVSEILHTNKTFVYALIKDGYLPALKLGSYKVRKESLLRFLQESEGKEYILEEDSGKVLCSHNQDKPN